MPLHWTRGLGGAVEGAGGTNHTLAGLHITILKRLYLETLFESDFPYGFSKLLSVVGAVSGGPFLTNLLLKLTSLLSTLVMSVVWAVSADLFFLHPF